MDKGKITLSKQWFIDSHKGTLKITTIFYNGQVQEGLEWYTWLKDRKTGIIYLCANVCMCVICSESYPEEQNQGL